MRALLLRVLPAAAVLLLVGALAVVGKAWWDSRLPGTYSVMDYGEPDEGGGAVSLVHARHGGAVSLTELRGPRGTPDARFTLTAKHAAIRLSSGRAVDALTYDGRSPGPELRVKQGNLVEVTLLNEDVEDGVTIHWHGVDVPNAEDGVAGVTQDAVLPGERHVYRFRAEQAGTFWYHTHQVSSKEVRRGLFGVLLVEPATGVPTDLELPVAAHTYDGVPTLNGSDVVERRTITPGTRVRLRLVNTDSAPHRFVLDGARYVVAAIDGTDLNEPSALEGTALEVAAGGRADLAFTAPSTPVWLSWLDTAAALAINAPAGSGPPASPAEPVEFDPLSYGRPAATPFDASSAFDRRFELTITRKPAFLDGHPGLQWAINGHVYPDVPTFVVDEGDLVEITISNETGGIHPMHLHGHHLLVLSRDGVTSTGSPWWVDTLDVRPDETYVVAFRADNPGIWMDHCHNLRHAADGLTMHVAYSGVTTPFLVGSAHHNTPE
jgi:FtsP/CotA-like multicopper oxidase with cupredoxin domain